jgi:hypothetical protein
VDSAKIKEITKTGVFFIDDWLSILTHEHEPLVALQNIGFVEKTPFLLAVGKEKNPIF